MRRRNFIKNTLYTGAGVIGASPMTPLQAINRMDPKPYIPLMGNRFVTLCILIRTSPWEVSRDVKLIKEDEYDFHTLKIVQGLREAFAKNSPEGSLTWGFTLNALEDKRPNYQDIRKYVAECQKKYGDEVSYFPGYFPPCICPVRG